VKGAHFLPEDSPEEMGSATATFVAKVLPPIRPDLNPTDHPKMHAFESEPPGVD
jgi:hypothetical protein